jgi:hypothetical protein
MALRGGKDFVMSQIFKKSAGASLRVVLAATLAFFGSAASHAVVSGDGDRPILESRMDIIEARADMANAKEVELVMTRRDGAPSVTGLILRVDGQPMNFELAKIKHDVCGTELYIGMASENLPERSYRLVVVDHSHETCEPTYEGNLHAYPVKASLEALLLDRNQPVLRMMGEPSTLVVAQ